jgi:hypothetical protein
MAAHREGHKQMEYQITDSKGALGILSGNPAWQDFRDAFESISRDDILAKHRSISAKRTIAPAGAQTAVNAVIKEQLTNGLGWAHRPYLFQYQERNDQGKWRLDFIKEGIGVDVSFNHVEAMAWTLMRMSVAMKSRDVKPSSRLEAGVAVFPTRAFKAWGKMDGAVGVYEQAILWLKIIEPLIEVPPVVLIGIDPGWEPTDDFRGTRKGR